MSKVTTVKKTVIDEVVIRLSVTEAATLQHILGNIAGEWRCPVRQLASDLYNSLPFGIVTREEATGDFPIVSCARVGPRGTS